MIQPDMSSPGGGGHAQVNKFSFLSTIASQPEQQVLTRIAELLTLVETRLGLHLPMPTVDFDLRGGRAGAAYPMQYRLRFNGLLLIDNTDHFLRQTVAHEVAHLVTYRLYGQQARPHGPEWRKVMAQLFGVAAARTHDYDIRIAAALTYVYRCGCRERQHYFSIRRHRNALRGNLYLCRHCRMPLSYDYKQDPLTRIPVHRLAIAHLLLANDEPTAEPALVRLLPTLTRGEPVGQVSLYAPLGEALQGWLRRTHTPIAQQYRDDAGRDPPPVLAGLSHAIVVSDGRRPGLRTLIADLRQRQIALRVLAPHRLP